MGRVSGDWVSVFVVFGSASDSAVYQPIADALKEHRVKAEIRVLSAHRTPKQLEKAIKKSKAKVFIAGAGMSAALPGVVASQTLCPVIGVPVHANYFGLDSLLSVHQMPSGTPVLGVGVNQGLVAAREATKILKGKKTGVTLLKRGTNVELVRQVERAREILEEFAVPFDVSDKREVDWASLNEERIYLDFVDLIDLDSIEASNAIVIHCPIAKPNLPEQAILVLDKARYGLWVGICRGDNAALGAVQVMNAVGGKYRKKLESHRKMLARNVLKADKLLTSPQKSRGKGKR